MTERGLVEAALRGNAEAFSALAAQYQRVMVASARQVTLNNDDAEDIAQDALIDAFRGLASLRDRSKFRPWLFGILRNKCLIYLQRRRPEELTLDETVEEIPAPMPAEMHNIADLLEQLPFIHREVLVMRYLQELDFRDMANLLGVSEQVVRKRCSRARAQLRALAVERDERRLRKAMAGLLALPFSDTFTHRVTQEVLTMAQATAKGKAAASGTSAALAWLLGWKGVATVGAIIVLGAGAATPLAIKHWRQHAAPPVRIQFVSVQPTPAVQQEAKIAGSFISTMLQPNPDENSELKYVDDVILRKTTGKSMQQFMTAQEKKNFVTMCDRAYEKYGSEQELRIVKIKPNTIYGMTFETLYVNCVCARGSWSGYFDFDQNHKIVNDELFK